MAAHGAPPGLLSQPAEPNRDQHGYKAWCAGQTPKTLPGGFALHTNRNHHL
jgi:hypothetical protein